MRLFSTILLGTATVLAPLAPLWAQMLPQAKPEEVGMSPERLDRIRPVMESYIAQNQMAGSIALIARRGKVAYLETFGMMDKENGKPMSRDAIFRMASMTKPIITVAALTLYEQGKYSMLDPVSKYLPDFAKMKVVAENAETVPANRQITVLDLFRHTSGINNLGPKDEKGEYIFTKLDIFGHTLEDGIRLMASAPLMHQPGTVFDYSPGPDVVGRLIEVWSRQPLDVYLDQSVLRPLHMPDTGFWVPEAKWSRLATLYSTGPNGQIVRRPDAEQDLPKEKPIYLEGAGGNPHKPGGGMFSTLNDYTRFAQMLLNGGQLGGVRILSPKTVDLMSADLLGDLPVLGGAVPPGYGFGLTVAVNRGPGPTASVGSAGEYYWEGGSGTDFFVDPKEKLLMVFLNQRGGGLGIARQFKRMVYQTVVQAE
jgi:CubicO group peptidase (beta-lactamase class C family)